MPPLQTATLKSAWKASASDAASRSHWRTGLAGAESGGYVLVMLALKLKQTRDGVCVVLPDELLGQLGAGKGDSIAITKCSDGFHLARLDADLAELAHGIEVLEQVLERGDLDLPGAPSLPPMGLAE